MNIAIVGVAPPYRGGISLHTAVLFHHLQKSHKVTCFNFTRQYPEFLFPGKTQYETSKPAVDIPSVRVMDSINPLTWNSTGNQILKLSPDLVIFRCWNPFFSLMMGYIARKIKIKNPKIQMLALCDNIIPHESHSIDSWLMKYFLNKMDTFLVQSSIVEKELLELIPDAKYVKLFHPLYNVFGEKLDKTTARKRLNIKHKNVILYFGMIRGYKGFDILIQSVKHLKGELEDFIVYAVGESYEPEEKYREMISAEGIEDVFKWENQYIPDSTVGKYFSIADVVALPYKTATQSGIVQIAYHFNIPVIVTDVGGLSEMVVEEKSGNIIPPNDPEKLADAISDFFIQNKNPAMSSFISDYKQKFSWEEFVRGMETLVID